MKIVYNGPDEVVYAVGNVRVAYDRNGLPGLCVVAIGVAGRPERPFSPTNSYEYLHNDELRDLIGLLQDLVERAEAQRNGQ